ncbi:MAG: hypothetical protein RL386_817, partial [Bacteroidota bacterium]
RVSKKNILPPSAAKHSLHNLKNFKLVRSARKAI